MSTGPVSRLIDKTLADSRMKLDSKILSGAGTNLMNNLNNLGEGRLARINRTVNKANEVDKTFLQGYWMKMHADALFADRNVDCRTAFEKMLINGANTFPCETCKPHFLTYLRNNPISECNSLFKWTVDFHNAVNVRLGKKIVELPEALEMFQTGNLPGCEACKLHAHHNTVANQSPNSNSSDVPNGSTPITKTPAQMQARNLPGARLTKVPFSQLTRLNVVPFS